MSATAPDQFLTQADFEAALDTEFRLLIDAQDERVIRLVEVEPRPARPGWEAFSLLFTSEDPLPPAHDTFTVTHARLGALALFIGPIQDASGQAVLEAVFNHQLVKE